MLNIRDRNNGLLTSRQDIELEQILAQLIKCSQRNRATVLAILTLLLGRLRNISTQEGRRLIAALEALPGQIEQILSQENELLKY